jgi:hypothetical protein
MKKGSKMTEKQESQYIPVGVKNEDIYKAALSVLKDTSEDTPMIVKDLVSGVVNILGLEFKPHLIYKDVSSASQDPSSGISSRKGRGGGYFISSVVVEQSAEIDQVKINKQDKVLEEHLWPIVSLWLRETKSVERTSYKVANLKRGGIWSNPDVVGLSTFEDLGFFDVEVVTAEVKPNLSNWRYFFFEAVSHKRFSERSYFVYRDDSGGSHENELRQYSEKYGVGLVKMDFSDDDVKTLAKWKTISEVDKVQFLEAFVEIIPSPFDPISVRDKVKFLNQIGVVKKKDLHEFGDED